MHPVKLIAATLTLCACQTGKPVKEATSSYIVEPVRKASGKVAASVGAGVVATSLASKNFAQKSAIATQAPGSWYATQIDADALRQRMATVDKASWFYIGSRGDYNYLAKEFIDRKIFRVKKEDFRVEDPFKLTVRKARWTALPRVRHLGE